MAFKKLRILLGLKADPNAIPAHARIGRHSKSLDGHSFFNCTEQSPVEIGSFCAIAPGVRFFCQANHPTDTAANYALQHQLFKTKSTFEYLRTNGPIKLGHDVWIGTDAIVLSGVTIGDGAVIAARSVVARDVPPYAIVGGNPARIIKYRFPDQTIAAMQKIRWWDWPTERLMREKAAFDLPAEQFVARFLAPPSP
ncbi:CatB-related O-acetyltransferase [Mesorhizobium sp. M4B.F.Ca.ET.215.01.1.1]|uniref:CatB-related O-acetyltransferase n=1 Tax=unclassified Mesorhizobium TaxID=325217 RepID=UPI000FCB7BCD|nr:MULTISPECIES: CatB-related O-acetyltransferase [unclassified Mesorhizobium]RUW28200.1 CatB-related O-acetyltransferase [Mesorhizobium sp. M4B.F.Ca.ET.013.02.1.1]RVD35683.1 CatB-related O-acetyltransferase [Mesorhizobium sp. M4B.F.Ca.ET.019.03.1.1]TGQ15105.1 CatB-related O-acetyltransferase [Mesorhizobium sp. M4B.F.Ca.ET.215.01.1.1]TGQ48688.1 CatB-related O-acetyltransferase [Mesorhizobium sp. M00.F.Ca.ET.220.01.1.1]TGR11172.1 CatB-related O-acetyltransferase [Mesorhizobium sp. M4B.F.Ca.ET.2